MTANDGNGNTQDCSFNVTLKDENPPSLTCPSDLTIDVDGDCETDLVDYTTSAGISDDCTLDANINVNQAPVAGTTISGHG